MKSRPFLLAFVCPFALLSAAGCASKPNTFTILDQRSGASRTFQEHFDTAIFSIDEAGRVDIVFTRADGASDGGGPDIEQTLHIKGVWRSIPGRTVAESSQINATVQYRIDLAGSSILYAGAGSLIFLDDKDGETIEGSLESALLRPTRTIGSGPRVFERVEVSGFFQAVRQQRETVRLVNDLKRDFADARTLEAGE